MDETSTLEILAYSFGLARDFLVAGSLFLAVLGLFQRRDRQKAAMFWVMGIIATIASAVIGETFSLLNIPDSLIALMLIVSGGLIFFSSRRAGRRGGVHIPRKKSDDKPSIVYRQRNGLLTAAEHLFYQTLIQTTDGQVAICPKVGLWDIFDVPDSDQTFVAKSRIDRKHVDFLLCDPTSMRPVVAIELDDSSHNRPDRRARDQFVDEVFQSAGLPLVHVRAQRSYNAATLAQTLSPYLGYRMAHVPAATPTPVPSPSYMQYTEESVPACPKCGAPMVVRTATRGQYRGKEFYACTSYPECRGILSIS